MLLLVLAALTACTSTERLSGGPEPAAATTAPPPAEPAPPPAPPAPPAPPPVDLAGKWRLSAAGGSACLMTLAGKPGAADGTVAPAGGCPGNFFTSRKWTFEHDMLIVRDYKGQVLVELAFADGRFEGKDLNGTAIRLVRP